MSPDVDERSQSLEVNGALQQVELTDLPHEIIERMKALEGSVELWPIISGNSGKVKFAWAAEWPRFISFTCTSMVTRASRKFTKK